MIHVTDQPQHPAPNTQPRALDALHELITYLCIALVILLAAGMARGQTDTCIPPDGSARPCAWYERSYILPKEQQEQILRGVLTTVAERYGYSMPVDMTPVAPPPAGTDMSDWPSTLDLARQIGLSKDGVLRRANVLGIIPHSTVRGGQRLSVYDPDQVAAITDYVDRRAGRKMPRHVGRNFKKKH